MATITVGHQLHQHRTFASANVRDSDVGGGTNSPGGLAGGLRALDEAARGRVKRIVLVSDGLDNTRSQAESLARASFGNGITVSSLGIGLDFDESYMGGVAQSGHGNFAFLKDGSNMAKFLERELDQTALTTIENATVRLDLPRGMRLVSALGASSGKSSTHWRIPSSSPMPTAPRATAGLAPTVASGLVALIARTLPNTDIANPIAL
ncbi:MAG: hypothetical protein ABL931_15105 [Usitatibacteraceae bacterium]